MHARSWICCRLGVVLTPLIIVSLAWDTTRADADWEYWSSYGAVFAAGDDLTVEVTPELRFNCDFSNYYDARADILLCWSLKSWLALSAGYLHAYRKGVAQWHAEYRPHLNATLKWRVSILTFTDRSLVEYRITQHTRISRYRQKLSVKLRKTLPREIEPYLAAEIFYTFDSKRLHENRMTTGVGLKAIQNLTLALYYTLVYRRIDAVGKSTNILATKLQYRF